MKSRPAVGMTKFDKDYVNTKAALSLRDGGSHVGKGCVIMQQHAGR
jgi:hypothetical protein